MLQGQVLPTPTTPPRTRREALELYAAFSFSRYVVVPWRVCSICIYVYTYMNVCLCNVNIYIYTYFLMLISCYYTCKYVSFRTRLFPVRLGWSKNFHVNDLVHTLISCGYNDPKQMGWVSQNFTFGSEPLWPEISWKIDRRCSFHFEGYGNTKSPHVHSLSALVIWNNKALKLSQPTSVSIGMVASLQYLKLILFR